MMKERVAAAIGDLPDTTPRRLRSSIKPTKDRVGGGALRVKSLSLEWISG